MSNDDFLFFFSSWCSNVCFIVKSRLPEDPVHQRQIILLQLYQLVTQCNCLHPGCLVSMTCKQRGLDSVLDFCVVFTGWIGRLTNGWGLSMGCGSRCLVWANTAGKMFKGGTRGYGKNGGMQGKKRPCLAWGTLGSRAGYGSGERFTGEYICITVAGDGSDKVYVGFWENDWLAAVFPLELVSQCSLSCKMLLLLFWPYSMAWCTCTWCCSSVTSPWAL